MRKILFFLLCLWMIGISGCGMENTDDSVVEPDFILTYAENHIPGYPTTKAAYRFAELVEERTGGKIRIQVKPNAEFGTQHQTIEQLQFGGVAFTRVSISVLTDELPELNVLQMPFIYEDAVHMWNVLDGEVGDEMMDAFEQIDLVPLSWFDAGARSFYSVEKIDSLEDLKGKTIRVQESELMRDMVRCLGGNPIDLAYSEVYSGFETKKIDAAENNWASYTTSAHYDIAHYYIVDEHTRVPEIQLISGEIWRLLNEEQREIIKICAQESAEYEKELWKEVEESSRKTALEAGTQEIILSEEEIQKFQDAVIPLYEKYCSEYTDLINKINEQRSEGD